MQLITLKCLLYVPVCMPVRQYMLCTRVLECYRVSTKSFLIAKAVYLRVSYYLCSDLFQSLRHETQLYFVSLFFFFKYIFWTISDKIEHYEGLDYIYNIYFYQLKLSSSFRCLTVLDRYLVSTRNNLMLHKMLH